MESFFNAMKQLMVFSPEARAALERIMTRHVFSKGYHLVSETSVCNHFYFIEKGLTRTYYIKNNKDVTDWFSSEGQFAVSILSFLTRRPDIRNIELLEDSVLWALEYHDMEAACARHHEIEHFIRLLLAQAAVVIQQRFDDIHFSSAKERYQRLLVTNPGIVLRAPLGYVASYLGITQETLSRIRSGQ